MKKHIIILLAALFAITSCDKSDLKEIQYIDDPDYPGLPIYSDLGYNTFGAYFNQKVFTIHSSNRPFYMVADHDGLSMTLYGQLDSSPLTLTFNVPLDTTFILEDYHDLLALDGSSFAIDTLPTACTIMLEGSYAPTFVSIYSGKITFDDIRQVVVDKDDAEVIVAGKFQFRAIKENGTYLDVVGGRFDLGIDDSNFVNFRR